MEYIHLGRSGLSVSRLCLGTMNFGPLTPPAESHAIMDHAHEIGINFFDTANRYGGGQTPPGQVAGHDEAHSGWTEEIIGDWFASGGGRRERTVLATKLYGAMGDWPNEGKLSALNIRRACDASLRRLRTDHIDLYQMHHIDRDTPWDEIWQAMEVLVAQGKILYVGSSNFAGWHIAQANDTAAARGFFGLVSEQSIYNLLTREVELEVLPAAIEYGVGVIPWSPLQGGLLGGVQRVTNIELFFDLVYVFAVTQLSHYLIGHSTLSGAVPGRARRLQAGGVARPAWPRLAGIAVLGLLALAAHAIPALALGTCAAALVIAVAASDRLPWLHRPAESPGHADNPPT